MDAFRSTEEAAKAIGLSSERLLQLLRRNEVTPPPRAHSGAYVWAEADILRVWRWLYARRCKRGVFDVADLKRWLIERAKESLAQPGADAEALRTQYLDEVRALCLPAEESAEFSAEVESVCVEGSQNAR